MTSSQVLSLSLLLSARSVYIMSNRIKAMHDLKLNLLIDTIEFCINKQLWQLYNSMASGSHIKYQLGPRPNGP